MTTIAYDGRHLAADTASRHCSGNRSHFPAIKLAFRMGEEPSRHFAFAVAGAYLPLLGAMIGWWERGADPHNMPPAGLSAAEMGNFMVVSRSPRRAWIYSHLIPYPDEDFAPFVMGSGGDLALGAMRAGKNAMEAVVIAAIDDPRTNNDVRFIDIDGMHKGIQCWPLPTAAE